MSAAKRRVARKIALLVRMDATHSRMLRHSGPRRARRFWCAEMTALGNALEGKGLREAGTEAIVGARIKRGEWPV